MKSRRRQFFEKNWGNFLISAILLVLMTVLIAVDFSPGRGRETIQNNKIDGNSLDGLWKLDDVTSYRFDKGGTGSLCLPSGEYVFHYRVEENQLFIDFEDEQAADVVYTVRNDGNTLEFFIGPEFSETEKPAYILKKEQ